MAVLRQWLGDLLIQAFGMDTCSPPPNHCTLAVRWHLSDARRPAVARGLPARL